MGAGGKPRIIFNTYLMLSQTQMPTNITSISEKSGERLRIFGYSGLGPDWGPFLRQPKTVKTSPGHLPLWSGTWISNCQKANSAAPELLYREAKEASKDVWTME